MLATLEQNELLQHKPQLRTRITLRAPDIDALSHLQLRALRLLRNKGTETDDPSDPQTRQQWAKVLLLTVKGLQPACRTPAEASRTSGANRQRTGRRGRRRCGCPVTGLLSGPDLADLTWRHSSCLIGPEGE